MNLTEFAKEVHQNAVEHGWWEEERPFSEIIALCHSELSEALEEYRNGKPKVYVVRDTSTYPQIEQHYRCITNTDIFRPDEKPEGIATELADCILRILDFCGKENIDIEKIIKIKHEYNKTRPYKHGGKRA